MWASPCKVCRLQSCAELRRNDQACLGGSLFFEALPAQSENDCIRINGSLWHIVASAAGRFDHRRLRYSSRAVAKSGAMPACSPSASSACELGLVKVQLLSLESSCNPRP